MALQVVILAAGLGQRMRSSLPKVLHLLAGKPLLAHILETAQALQPQQIHVVYGHGGEQLKAQFAHYPIHWVEQRQQLGTGHALQQALPHLAEQDQVLSLYGDVPLLSLHTLQQLLQQTPKHGLGLVTAQAPNPYGLGRMVRGAQGQVLAIVEERDATPEQRQLTEIYSGILTTSVHHLQQWLPQLQANNAQNEYYITAIIPLAVQASCPITTVTAADFSEVQGVNDRAQLIQLERIYQRQMAERLLQQGVTVMDPTRFDARCAVLDIATDVTIDVNVILEGNIHIGSGTTIGPNCYLRDVHIGSNVTIKANTIIEEASIAAHATIGPFARIRPGTELAEAVNIGNFVELKNSQVATGSKINHLSYIGDTTVGKDVIIGAGTITCNYNGVLKQRTTIADEAFIGSGTQLIAPVTIGVAATIGAGSTITSDAPAQALTLSRVKQRTISHWQRPQPRDKIANASTTVEE